MQAVDRMMGRLSVALVIVACLLLFGMMLAICIDVLLRNVAVPGLPRGLAVANDFSESAIYLMTLLSAPFLLRSGRHIRIDILLHMVPPRLGWLMELVACSAMVVCCAAMVWYGFSSTIKSAASGSLLIKTIVYPEWWSLAPFACVFALLAIESILRFRSLLSGPRQPRNEQVSI